MSRHHSVRQRGAAMAEYLPPLAIGVMVLLMAYQAFGDRIRDHVGEVTQQFATHYYQGWFYPKDLPGEAGMSSATGSNKGSGGPAAEDNNESRLVQQNEAGNESDNTFNNPFISNDNHHPSNPFAPAGNDSSCTAEGSDVTSSAPNYTQFGNPIDIGNGNKFQHEIDHRQPGDTPLHFERFYNSRHHQSLLTLGYGWRHSYQRQIYPLDKQGRILDTNLTEAITLQVVRDDGSVFYFSRHNTQSGTQWKAPGVVDQMLPKDDGWLYRSVQGTKEFYDARGRLQFIDHTNGVRHQLQRDDQGRLHQIRDSRGPMLQLHYQHNWLQQVDLPNNQVVRFYYNDSGQLITLRQTHSNLWEHIRSLWQQPDRQYHYEAKHFSNGLTGITDAEGRRYATWDYDHLGRANLSQHGDGVEQLTFDYRDANTVVMTNAAGHISTLTLESARPGHRRLVRLNGHATPTCTESRQQYQYNPHGFLNLTIDASGHASRYQRNPRGLITKQEDGLTQLNGQWQATNGTHRTEQTWHPLLPVITQATYSTYHQGQWQAFLQRQWQYSNTGHLLKRIDTDLSQPQSAPTQHKHKQRQWIYEYQFHDKALGQISRIQLNGPRLPMADGRWP